MGSKMFLALNLAVYALAYRDYVVGEPVEPLAHRHADPARYLGDRIESFRPRAGEDGHGGQSGGGDRSGGSGGGGSNAIGPRGRRRSAADPTIAATAGAPDPPPRGGA